MISSVLLEEDLDFQYMMSWNSREKKKLLSECVKIRFHAIRNVMIFVVLILYDYMR